MLSQNNDDDDDNNEEKEEQHQQFLHETTSLQRRCIKSLATSNWSGKENDVELVCGSAGKLTQIITPIVVEELLIESVISGRKLGTKLYALQAEVQVVKQLRIDENNKTHEQIRTLKVDLLKAKKKQYQLAKAVDDEVMKRKLAERILVKFDSKLEEEKKRLYSMKAKLEAKLEEEKKRSYDLDIRFRALELLQRKKENDREILELTCTETITRLDVMSSQDEWWNNACGSVMSPLILMFSTMSDRRECEKIKAMLQQVVEDQLSKKSKNMRERERE
mmetsp:Transcript_16704/g.19263  ORF Transcript_16704/g.19263 Transcript_16704/m.19263 type:complete len:277 (-) Transcript_16704:216-1046(-)